MEYRYVETQIGPLLLAGVGERLQLVHLPGAGKPAAPHEQWRHSTRALGRAASQIEAYFAGDLRRFELDLEPRGTEFQLRVWWALAKIPYGTTWSYAELAVAVGRPSATRAVGAANGRNPLPIVLPCHRVIGSDGSLTGFGGGLEAKRRLLELEGALPATLF